MRLPPPGAEPFTQRTPRVVAARRLTRRSERQKAGRFLAEGANAVGGALDHQRRGRGVVHELFVTSEASDVHGGLVRTAHELGVPVSLITGRAADELSETVTPQGIVAVCDLLDRSLDGLFGAGTALAAVLVDVADPGNAGTVIRVADAAGADAVILAGDSVDPHNGKCVRASAGSLFHRPVARVRDTAAALRACREAGLRLLAAHGYAERQLDSVDLAPPTAWVFGSEAHGLPAAVLHEVDMSVRIPIYGEAESLNLATAAAVCLYATAMARRGSSGG